MGGSFLSFIAKPQLWRAESRFAKPRKFPKGNTAARRKKHTECAVPTGTKLSERKVSKGFNWACANLLFMCAGSRFAEPRSFLKKVLIVAVWSCGCGTLLRGLQNLEASCKGDVFTFFLRRAKRTKKHARGLRTSGLRGRFKALPEKIL